MKHINRIISVMTVLSLLLSIETNLQAQKFQYVKQNSDGSYDETVVIETFFSYIDTVKNLPTTEEENQAFFRTFLNRLPYSNDYEEIIIKKEDGREANPREVEEISQQCINLLKEKQAQVLEQQNDLALETQRSLPLTYKQIAIRIGLPVAVVLAFVIFVILLVKAKKKKERVISDINHSSNYGNSDNNNRPNDIIIRQKTSSVMYKQNLDDVINNSNYMAIDCTCLCNDTAVKTMYIKNSCIIDIYNMYAEDLRNPNNPKEDGCMVLGRWIHDEKLDEYSVSLEEFVKPGNDAVFAEYELDFGGKIKVIVNEKLRKLRRETNLQYDLTCWVHSHPGLGVFFSNTDCNLHLLHKHPTHPKFLTAIVVDILTPQEELGIFTFKHDMSINSKADLKQLYSLEEWYKWAVESKRTAVVEEEHYNTLDNAKSRDNGCYNVQLSNSAIIDIDLIASNQDRDSLYFVHGFSAQQSNQTINIAVKIDNTHLLNDNELIGCFLAVTHRSYPTIKKDIASYVDKIKFVLVYSIADGMLTTIPIIDNDLCADESYYGEQPLEELKIWTRRKR